MTVSRRHFLLGTAAVVAISAELAELLSPKRTIFLPPRGGWWSREADFSAYTYNIATDSMREVDWASVNVSAQGVITKNTGRGSIYVPSLGVTLAPGEDYIGIKSGNGKWKRVL